MFAPSMRRRPFHRAGRRTRTPLRPEAPPCRPTWKERYSFRAPTSSTSRSTRGGVWGRIFTMALSAQTGLGRGWAAETPDQSSDRMDARMGKRMGRKASESQSPGWSRPERKVGFRTVRLARESGVPGVDPPRRVGNHDGTMMQPGGAWGDHRGELPVEGVLSMLRG